MFKFTSFNVQPFNLEAGTEIDRNPERIGITDVHREGRVHHGYRYGYRYETQSGMGMKESFQMAKYITKKVKEANFNV